MGDLLRATRLEFNFLKESRLTLVLSFFLPLIFSLLFGFASQTSVAWKDNTTYFMLYAPMVLPLFILFLSTQLTVLRIVGERAPYGTLDRDLLSLSRTGIFFGKFLIGSLIGIVQALIVFLISFYVFNLPISPLLFAILSVLIAIFGVSLGLFISVISSNKEQATQIVPFFIIVLFIFNGSIISLDNMGLFGSILSTSPVAIGTDSLTRMVSSNQGFPELNNSLIFMAIWTVLTLFIGWIKFSLESYKK